MPQHRSSLRTQLLAGGVALILLADACLHVSAPEGQPRVVAAPSRSAARSYMDKHTPSAALDRIDQKSPQLYL